MPSAWSFDSVECVICMVAARHARHAQRVICTHVMLTPTPSLPFPAVPSACAGTAVQLRCRVAVIASIGAAGGFPFHLTCSSSPFSTSLLLHYQVRW